MNSAKMLYGDIVQKKMDEDTGDRIVSGFFTDDKVDLHGHIIGRDAMVTAIADYDKWRNVREMHRDVVGVAVSVGEKSWNWIDAKIIPDDTWKLIEEGAYRGFSVGIIVTDGEWLDVDEIPAWAWEDVSDAVKGAIQEFGYVFHITGLELVEISVVDRPANPRAVIESNKGLFGGVDHVAVLPSVVNGYVEISKAFGIEPPVTKQEEQVDEEKEVATTEEVAETETEQEEKVEDAEVTKDLEVEETEQEVDEEETENKEAAADVVIGMFDKLFERLDNIEKKLDEMTEVEEVEVKAANAEIDVEDIVEKVMSLIESRKAAVNTGEDTDQTEETTQSVNLKEMSRHELADLIAVAASKRARL